MLKKADQEYMKENARHSQMELERDRNSWNPLKNATAQGAENPDPSEGYSILTRVPGSNKF